MKKILFLLVLVAIAARLNAQTPRPKTKTSATKVDTAKRDNMPVIKLPTNMPMRVIVPKYNSPMPIVRPDSVKGGRKTKSPPRP